MITHRNAGQITSDNPSNWYVLYPHTVVNGKRVPYNIELYPNSYKYLQYFRNQLENRVYIKKANRKWYEIWVPQDPIKWAKRKIVFRDIADVPQFWLDESGAIINGDCYWIDVYNHTIEDEVFLALAVANSEFILQYYDTIFNNRLYSGKRRFMAQYVEQFPIPDPSTNYAQAAISVVRLILSSNLSLSEKNHKIELINELIMKAFTC